MRNFKDSDDSTTPSPQIPTTKSEDPNNIRILLVMMTNISLLEEQVFTMARTLKGLVKMTNKGSCKLLI